MPYEYTNHRMAFLYAIGAVMKEPPDGKRKEPPPGGSFLIPDRICGGSEKQGHRLAGIHAQGSRSFSCRSK